MDRLARAIEDSIYSIAVFAVVVAGLSTMFGLFADNLSDGQPAAKVSCTGKVDCRTQRFEIGEGRMANCAIWDGNQVDCLVETQ